MSGIVSILVIGFVIAFLVLVLGELLIMLLPLVLGVWIITAIFPGGLGFLLGIIFVVYMVLRKK